MPLVTTAIHNRVAYITLNRPDKHNALNPQLIAELSVAFESLKTDDQAKIIVLKANGPTFSAGADLAYLQQLQANSREENIADIEQLKNLLVLIHAFPKTVIAQVEGHAIAGGCGLVSVCDLVFAVPDAKFGYTEVKIGFVPALVACFLVRKLGSTRTSQLLLSGELIAAETALQYGLINFVADATLIGGKVEKYAEGLARQTSAHSVRFTKQIIQQAQGLPLDEALNAAVLLNAEMRTTADFMYGISTFLSKEKPEW